MSGTPVVEQRWYCPKCNTGVAPDGVTFSEHHDARYGGCGFAVEPAEVHNSTVAALQARIAELEKVCEEMTIYIKHDSLRPSIPHRRVVEALRAAGYLKEE